MGCHWVTSIRFWCLLSLLPASFCTSVPAQVPSPQSVLGHKPGEDFYLAGYTESLSYFRRLDEASDRVQLVRVGETSEGREWYLALISSPENLARLDHYKEIAGRMAWARDLSDEEARRLAVEGKAIVHIDGGLHATEVAHAQHTIQLAYDLVSHPEDPEIKRILDEVILVLWFSINPDGQEMVASWYRRNLGTPFEVSPLPWLYQKYVGHDNNRDGYMNNMVESQVVTRTTLEFNPQVFYNHHQTAPFPARIWIPPFAEPISSNAHPLMWRWVNLFGTAMAAYLDEHGMPGAIHRGQGFDDWYPGFIDHVNTFRNTVSFLTETALYHYATPHFYTVEDFPESRQDLRSEVLYASPWKGGWWRLGNAVEYMLAASMSVLDTAARYRESLLYNRYQAGRDTIAHYRKSPPYAYLIPCRQPDLPTAALLVEKMRLNGLEVREASQPFQANGRRYAAGTWVILMDQPFANLVRELFEVQEYPDLRDYPEGPPDLPYDVAGWTLPLQMGVEAIAVRTELDAGQRAAFTRLDSVVLPAGGLSGSGSQFRLDLRANATTRLINGILGAGGRVAISNDRQSATVSGLDRQKLEELSREYPLPVESVSDSRKQSESRSLKAPRVGLYRPWQASIDEGWTRWLLEDYGFNPASIYNGEIQAGHLRESFDAIVFADMSERTILQGHPAGTIPDEYAGGITERGMDNLIEFVREGGTLITFNNSSRFAMEHLNLPVEDVVGKLKDEEFFGSGSLLRVQVVDANHPVVTGMPSEPVISFQRSPVFEVKPGFQGTVLARYPKERNPLVSGYLLHPEKIQGKAALLDVSFGKGRVILFGFKPQWRGQSHGTYKLIFNSLYYAAEPAAPTVGAQGDSNETARIWATLQETVYARLAALIEKNKAFHSARGEEAVAASREFDSLVKSFESGPLKDLSDLAVAGNTPAAARQAVKRYASQLKSLLVEMKSKDFSLVDYSIEDLAQQYRLHALEEEISRSIGTGE